MKVLITGASGFVGRAIVEELAENQFEIVTSGRRGAADVAGSAKLNYLRADLTDPAAFAPHRKVLRGVQAIVHNAGLAHQFGVTNEIEFHQTNAEGTRRIAELAAQVKAAQLVLISSVAVYGQQQNGQRWIDETYEPSPRGAYATSKLKGEQAAREICDSANIKLTVLRLATVYGEGDPGNIRRLIGAIDKNRFVWIGRGRNLKSLVYRRDVARAVRVVLAKPRPEKYVVYNVVGQTIEMRRIVQAIVGALGKQKDPFIFVPQKLPRVALAVASLVSGRHQRIERWRETLEKWLSDDAFSGEKFNRDFECTVSTPLDEGLKLEVEEYLKQKKAH